MFHVHDANTENLMIFLPQVKLELMKNCERNCVLPEIARIWAMRKRTGLAN